MKKLRKAILALLCVGMIFGVAACGTTDDNAKDDAANNKNNDVTENQNSGNVIDDMGNATDNVLDDIGNGVENVTDDMTGSDNGSNDRTR